MSDHPRARRPNEDRVLALLTRSGQASRGELARELRLPKATVADLVARLISQGLIASAPVPDSGRQVGSGLIVGDRLHRGARGFAGELAHVQVRENGPVCACGGRGCLIRTISAEMIDLAQPAYEPRLTYPAMIGLAESGDVGMQRLLGDFGRAIGRPLADLCTLLNPGLFVLDGSIGQAGEHVIAGMREVIDRHACPVMSAAAQVVPGSLGNRAEVLGAVVLARLAR